MCAEFVPPEALFVYFEHGYYHRSKTVIPNSVGVALRHSPQSFGAPVVIRRPGNCALPRYAPACEVN